MAQPNCFHEADPALALSHRAAAEGIGTMLLVIAASGAGIAASRAFPTLPGMVLPIVALTLAGALVSLIVALGGISGGHFNPLITGLQWASGERPLRCLLAYAMAQLAGGMLGGWLAARLWLEGPALPRGGWAGFPSELLASFALMLIVFGCARSGRPESGPFAVGGWLFAAVVAMPTTSYANPAIVLGAMVSAGPFALGRGAASAYLLAEMLGTVLTLGVVRAIFPQAERAA